MLRLALHTPPPVPLELLGLTPDRVLSLSADAVARLPVLCGNRREPVGAFFTVTGDAADGAVLISGDCSRVKQIGAGMTAGELTVDGPAGTHCGAGMSGGVLTVRGDAGDWLAAELRGGTVRVHGRSGDQPAAAYRGSRHGVAGGVVVVHGDAGAEAGTGMRRGLLAVGGRCGSFAGAGMIAGTVVVAGGAGPHAGAGMKRGTLVLPTGPDRSPGFAFACEFAPAYLGLLARWLKDLDAPAPPGLARAVARCWRGDVLAGGRGEWLAVG